MQNRIDRIVDFKKSDATKRIVYGEVYVPDERDSDGNWMSAVKVADSDTWAAVEKGEITGFSIEGRGELISEQKGVSKA